MGNEKPTVRFRLDVESYQWLEDYVRKTGKLKTDVCKEALVLFRKERDSEKNN